MSTVLQLTVLWLSLLPCTQDHLVVRRSVPELPCQVLLDEQHRGWWCPPCGGTR